MMQLTLSGFFAAFLSAVYLYFPESTIPSPTADTPQDSLQKSYDFIIVGAGSAGCVLANRLTENENWNIALIEAGGDGNAISDAPLLFRYAGNSELNWNYTTVKQNKSCLSREGVCPYPRGRVMGGSSTINAMYYARGNKADYDDWARTGSIGWSYGEVLPYFIKSENNTEPGLANSFFHGTTGPLNVQYPRYITPLREKFIKAAKEFGWKKGDYNGKRQDVAGYLQTTINGPSREDTAKAYLNPIKCRKNLSIIKSATVTRILIENKKAVGVEYYRNGNIFTLTVNKEVILSAGAIDTPKLLMLSGIGPKDELEKYGIKMWADLPVGKNLQDHLQVPILFEINKKNTITTNKWRTKKSIDKYTIERTGPLTTPGAEAMAFINTNNKSEPPNFQYTWLSYVPIILDDQNINIIYIILSNVKPKSVGSVRLKSANWNEKPLIDPNYFSDDNDFEAFQKGSEYIFDYMKTPTMSRLSPKLYLELQPECIGKTLKEFINCNIYYYSATLFHPVGTAKMGGAEDKEAVVDPNLKVYGIENLRVIDASVMPSIPRANTNAPTIMIAEKGSDIIKAYHIFKDGISQTIHE